MYYYTCIYTSNVLGSCIYLHCNNYKLLFPEAALFLLACTIPSVVRACVLLHNQWCETDSRAGHCPINLVNVKQNCVQNIWGA